MRDRLIKLSEKAHKEWLQKEYDHETDKDIGEFVADYLLENGVIVPPCKVGDMVYCIYSEKVIQGNVRLIRPFISKKETVFKGNIICEVDNIFLDDCSKEEIELYVVFEKPYGIERIAYLTKEEAEQALRKEDEKNDK